jgi:hypothetical protein
MTPEQALIAAEGKLNIIRISRRAENRLFDDAVSLQCYMILMG